MDEKHLMLFQSEISLKFRRRSVGRKVRGGGGGGITEACLHPVFPFQIHRPGS